ncbi:hypothetical protein Tco_1456595 [Tanacetum coccineum]
MGPSLGPKEVSTVINISRRKEVANNRMDLPIVIQLGQTVLKAVYDISYRLQQLCKANDSKQTVIDHTEDAAGFLGNWTWGLIW